MNVEQRVRRVVAKKLEWPEEKVRNSFRFGDDLGADHVDMVEVMMILEEEFDVAIPEEVAENFTTIQDAVDFLNTRQQ